MLSFCNQNTIRWGNPSTGFFNLDLLSKQPPRKQKYSVKFAEVCSISIPSSSVPSTHSPLSHPSQVCRVVLVPKREEYKAAGIKLWWTTSEFNQFKKVCDTALSPLASYPIQERYAELTEEHSHEDTQPAPVPKPFTSCFLLTLSVLVVTSRSPMRCPLLNNFSKFLWSDANPDRLGTSVSVSFTSHEAALATLLGGTVEHSVVIIDNSCPRPLTASVSASSSAVSAAPPSAPASVTCELVRRSSHTAVIICVMESEAAIQSNDDPSAELADLLLPHPQVPSCEHWAELLSLFVQRKDASDFLPSPLVQQYITAL
jgi:hypothetical protein